MDTDPDLYYPGGINMIILITMMNIIMIGMTLSIDDNDQIWDAMVNSGQMFKMVMNHDT